MNILTFLISVLFILGTGTLFDHFFYDHPFYPEFIRNSSPYVKGLIILFVALIPALLYEEIKSKNSKNKNK